MCDKPNEVLKEQTVVALRVVMMGTGEFALPTFNGLYETGHTIVGLYTQPDRTGRGHHHHQNPMKQTALEHETPVFQPESIKTAQALDELRSLNADLYVVAAYGQILSKELLQIPRCGAINVHASLLPKYRGAAPIQHAILNGETETGITIFEIRPKLDAGPILGTAELSIGPKETAGELEQRLAELAVPLTKRVIDQIESGKVDACEQDSSAVTLAPRLQKSTGAVDWSQRATEIGWHIRAMQPWPNAFTFLEPHDGDPIRLILLDVELSELDDAAPPGTVLFADRKHLVVQTGDGALELLQVRPQGKRAMAVADFLCGHTIQAGDRLANLSAFGN
jgi:methionyl-tRNA formyltransferase